MSATTMPKVLLNPDLRDDAAIFFLYPSLFAASTILSAVSFEAEQRYSPLGPFLALRTNETKEIETPAASATSRIVTVFDISLPIRPQVKQYILLKR